jgi:uncharacterized protein
VSLQFNVSQLLKSDVGQTRDYRFEADQPLNLGDGAASDVNGDVRFTLTNFGILARGRANAILHLTCARCLEPFETPTEVRFEEEYQPSIDIATGLPAKTPRSDTAFTISQNHTLDLSEALRQNLLIAVELIPVCSRDCQGLCPTCGVNRNVHTCHCHEPDDSSPFAVLQGLLAESDGDK